MNWRQDESGDAYCPEHADKAGPNATEWPEAEVATWPRGRCDWCGRQPEADR